MENEEFDFDALRAQIENDADLFAAYKQVCAAERLLKAKEAKDCLKTYIQFQMPHPEFPDEPSKSRYSVNAHHELLIQFFENVESGRCMRAANSIPPQHGKSTIFSQYGPAWAISRNPHKHIIIGTYSEDFAHNIGAIVRTILLSPAHKQVFPGFKLDPGSKAKNHMKTTAGGSLTFVGRGGGTTGRPADLFIIDDPIKDKEEADSPTIRNKIWDWFTTVAYTRCHTLTPISIIHTRWHEDDLIGRLCDPDHPEHDPEIAALWEYINVPAIIEEQDEEVGRALGLNVGDALWPERFSIEHLRQAQRMNPKNFSALYQGRPTPADGDYFTANMFQEFVSPGEIPDNLRIYAASDHAVRVAQENDWTCIVIAGVDERNNIWVLDVWWEKKKSDVVTDVMVDKMEHWEPLKWWAGKDHISGSIEPLLRRQMFDRNVGCVIVELPEKGDKRQKAQSIQGWMALGKVFFPRYANWYQRAKNEMLKFDSGTHDDFVDAMANLGRGLRSMIKPTGSSQPKTNIPKVGTLAWVKYASEQQKRMKRSAHVNGM